MGFFNKNRGYGNTIVVAASNSLSTSKSKADFICPGTNDQDFLMTTVFPALPSGGGEVKLLEGTYSIDTNSDPILFDRNNLSLVGSGPNTLIEADGVNTSIINTNAKTHAHISDLRIESTTGGANYGIISSGIYGTIDNVRVILGTIGEYSINVSNCSVTNSYIYGKYPCLIGNYGVISNCWMQGTVDGPTISGEFSRMVGCYSRSSAGKGIVSNMNYGVIAGNTVESPTTAGIYVYGGYSTITGNEFYNPKNEVILVVGTGNRISNNIAYNPSYSNANGYSCIKVSSAYNSISGNHFQGTTTPKYLIELTSASYDNVVIDNVFRGLTIGTGSLTDPSMRNRYSIMERSRMLNIVDADLDRYWHDADLTQATPYTTAVIAQPDYGRNVTMWITDADVGITGFRATVTGTTYTGKSITEQFHLASFSGGSEKKATGHYPFMTISNITVQNCVGEGAGDVLNVGCGLNIGFLGAISQSGDFVRYKVNEAITATPTPDYTYMTFPVTVGGPTDTYEVFYKRNRNYW